MVMSYALKARGRATPTSDGLVAPGIQEIEDTDLLYMIVERFRNQDPLPIYRRFQTHGRLAPDGLQYVSSWVDVKLECCFQLMETDDREYLDQWLANWRDLVEFEVYPVITSKEAAEQVLSRL